MLSTLYSSHAARCIEKGSSLTPEIWVVDDSPLEAEMARRPLSRSFDVELFADGTAMLERLSTSGPPRVLVLDWKLPGLSGIEILRFVRSTLDETSLPVLMVTVQYGKHDIVEGLSAGANDYLAKPYDESELVARVTTLYRMRKLADDLRAERREQERLLIEAREASARAAQANRAKDDFLATVSHELRTPLNAIAGWTNLLRSGALPAERFSDAFETIERNVRAQTHLIDDLLDVSRITSGKLHLSLEPTDMNEVVTAATKAFRPTADAKRILIRTELASGSATALADASRMQQVVGNLLANAVKFTPSGGHIDVVLRSNEAGLELTVKDDGQGIPAEVLPNIFNRFEQAESSFTRSHGGLGLGLAIVRHLVDLHRGHVSATSAGHGTGATFKVFLPHVEGAVEAVRRAPSSRPPAELEGALNGLHVLLVDDDADGREVTALFLRQQGARVDTVASAGEALAKLDRKLPDLLLSDIGMPEEDGLSLLRKVRARASAHGGSIPAIAITAYARSEDRVQSLLAGFDAYVTKPIEPEALVDAVGRVTGRFARRNAGE